MAKFDICMQISGIVSRTVEAPTLEEAEDIAKNDVFASDWNEMGCPEVDVMDYEEET